MGGGLGREEYGLDHSRLFISRPCVSVLLNWRFYLPDHWEYFVRLKRREQPDAAEIRRIKQQLAAKVPMKWMSEQHSICIATIKRLVRSI